jgi:hypothetical protein
MTLVSLRCIAVCLALAVSLIVVSSFSISATVEVSAQQQEKPVEQVQKNIQVLTGMPSSQLLPVMHFMRTSLGVRCDYCHIAENNKYWMDDKPAKQTARRMLRMVFEINKTNFSGRPVVTCNTCHRGSTKPIGTPAIGQGAFTNTTFDDSPPKALEIFPTADQLFERYVQALGGSAATDKIRSRTMTVTLLRPKLINSGSPRAAILNRGETVTIESFLKAPDKYFVILTTPNEVVRQGFNGKVGWTQAGTELSEMNPAQAARMKRQADLYSNLKLKDRYSTARVTGRERINGREAYVIEAQSVDNKTERLFFDVTSGFLLRRIVFTEIKLGVDPEQTDYEDYRKVDGVWLPFTVRTSYLDDNHYGTTRTITRVKHNVQIDDTRFEMPPKPK